MSSEVISEKAGPPKKRHRPATPSGGSSPLLARRAGLRAESCRSIRQGEVLGVGPRLDSDLEPRLLEVEIFFRDERKRAGRRRRRGFGSWLTGVQGALAGGGQFPG